MIRNYHQIMSNECDTMKIELPENIDLVKDPYKDKLLRVLDCTAIEFMHSNISRQISKDLADQKKSGYKVFDSTRGVFTEGGQAFPGAGIMEKSHIQICVRNVNCIKGFFKPRKEIDFPS